MTQAPATTVATAVRQHGGGRHPLNLLCTAPAGRLQSSRGGVIDRRAEGATSSNTLPASRAAAAHPTTGVRRPRELSPSLRSQNRPPAQLVLINTEPSGFRPTRLSLTVCQIKKVLELCESAINVILQLTACITHNMLLKPMKQGCKRYPKIGSNLMTLNIHVVVQIQLSTGQYSYIKVCRLMSKLHVGMTRCHDLQLTGHMNSFPYQPVKTFSSCALSCSRFSKPLECSGTLAVVGHSYCYKNSTYRTNRLHPSSSLILNTEVIQQDKHRPPEATYSQERPHHPYAGQYGALRYLNSLHDYLLHELPIRLNLVALVRSAQGGVAYGYLR